MEGKAMYTTKEAADYLGVSPSTIYRMEKRGLLSPTKTSGGQRRFNQKTLEKCLRRSRSFETLQIREKPATYEITAKAEPYFQEDSIKKNLWIGQMGFGLLWERVKRGLGIPRHSLWSFQEDV